MSDSIQIREVSAEDTWPLRHQILRPNQDFEKVKYAQDFLPTTFHLAATVDGKVCGIATFEKEAHPDFLSYKNSYRLRGMAVDPAVRKSGVGRRLIEQAEDKLRNQGSEFLWFNAREVAFSFYQKLGFHFHGPMFEIESIGPHKVMYKALSSR